MDRLRQLPLKLAVNIQTAAYDAGQRTASVVPQERHHKLQLLSGALVGAFAANTAAAFAAPKPGEAQGKITALLENVTTFLIYLVAFGSVLMLVWSAFLYITSGGNQSRVGQAKNAAKYVIIGLAIAAGLFIVKDLVLQTVDAASGRRTPRGLQQGPSL